ncbi:MAG: hypothetical protein IPQ16_10990 [Geobacteraceae bacterium]|nr:hypothetical protein [Geobacteraceae bacterium]
MRGHDIITAINDRRTGTYCFFTWWRNEEDFLDYDLIERFMENSGGCREIGRVDLLTLDDMWNDVRRVYGSRIVLLHGKDGRKVEWIHSLKTGVKKNTCAYTPETLIQIYDVETKGNAVDS